MVKLIIWMRTFQWAGAQYPSGALNEKRSSGGAGPGRRFGVTLGMIYSFNDKVQSVKE